jgi:inhibitor of KinA sporulation pathway (predicted exonuclease)
MFPEALVKFVAWMKPAAEGLPELGNILLASWGYYDRNQLTKDCDLHNVPYPFDDAHLNIKVHTAEKMGWNGKGVGKALALLGMEFEGTPHRGIDDVRNIIRIARKVGL